MIDVLVKNGRQIDAVNLAFAFELTEQFSPVLLLKSYLSEATKVSSPVKSGNISSVGQVCFTLSIYMPVLFCFLGPGKERQYVYIILVSCLT